MGGNLPHPDTGKWPGPWYSMDLSFATDYHPHQLSIQFYEELIDLHPELELYRKYLPKLLGPKRLMLIDGAEYSLICEAIRPRVPAVLDCLNPERKDDKVRLPNAIDSNEFKFRFDHLSPVLLEACRRYVFDWRTFLADIEDGFPSVLTTVGEMMGSATSFPLMPMVSFYAGWKSGLNRMISCGDDALVSNAKQSKVVKLEAALASCGAKLSLGDPSKGKPNKIFLHPRKGLFKEVVFVDGKAKPSVPISIWSSPSGGSKGQIDWVTQGSAAREMLEDQGLPLKMGLWAYSPLRRQIEAAWFMGLPVSEQVSMGGVLYAGFPHRALGQHDRWLSYLNSLRIDQLVCGTGLSPVPAPQTAVVRTASREWVRELVDRHQSDNSYRSSLVSNGLTHEEAELSVPRTLLPTCLHPSGDRILQNLKDAMDTEAAALTNWTLYWSFQQELSATPSIRQASGKFRRKLRTFASGHRISKAGKDSYANTVSALQLKAELYVDSAHITRTENRDLTYGLRVVERPYKRSDVMLPPGSLMDRIAARATSIK
jgi:hypothetical protein